MQGSILFADVSGFTPIAESLSALGAEGGEILTDILNRYFSEMVGLIHSHGGEVVKFGGDSILCFFAGDGNRERVLSAAQSMQRSASKFQSVKTPVRKFSLQMKAGISSGEVLIAGIGNPELRCEYIFAGEPVNRACQAEQLAKSGDVIVDQNGDFKKLAFFEIPGIDQNHSDLAQPQFISSRNMSVKPFLIPEVYEMLAQGYSRYAGALQRVIPVFMQFTGFSDQRNSFLLHEFHQFFSLVAETAAKYGGRFNTATMGDKGQIFYLLFGAPNRLEKKEEAANQWSLEIRERIRRDFPQTTIRIGMSEGRVFSGIVGGSGRFYYTVVGDPVNLAARLMTVAAENQICVSEELKTKSETIFVFTSCGSKRLKGKTQLIPVYGLEKQQSSSLEKKGQHFVGRTGEVVEILGRMESARNGTPQMVVIEGEAGIGKSYLAKHALNLCAQEGWMILSGTSEFTKQKHAYAPWNNVFQTLFPGRNVESFQEVFAYDAKTQKTILHHRLCITLLEAVVDKRVVLFLDDLHWFDSLSLELLAALLNHLKDHQFFVIAASRPEWQKAEFISRANCHFISLSEMSQSITEEMANSFLGSPVKEYLLDFLYRSARGNPFFTSQLLEYLRVTGALLRIGGEWTISKETEMTQSLSGEELIIAQMERLTWIERIHLRAAACMGPTFYVPILRKALGKQFRKATLESLLAHGYFRETEESWATFSQSLIQEAVYQSIPMGIRKGLHRRIGRSMESAFRDDLKKYYPNLANHFRLAGLRSKAIAYSIEAADQLYKSLSFPESRFYFQVALDLLRKSSDARRWDVGLKLVKNLIHTGHLIEGLQLIRKLRAALKRTQLNDFYYRACILQFDLMRRLSDYSYLRLALKLLKDKKMSPNRHYQILHLVGSGYFWLGLPEQAEKYLTEVTIASDESIDPEAMISANVFLANISADRQQFDSARRTIERALSLARKTGHLYQDMRIRSEWAGILCDNGSAEEARKILTKLLPEAESIGDFYLVAAILIGLGQAAIKLAQWEIAEGYFKDALQLFSTIGVFSGKAKTLMWFGILEFYRGHYERAYEFYKTATETFEEVQEMVEACHGYYNLAEACVRLDRFEEAAAWYDRGLKSFRRRDNPQLAELYRELGLMIQQSQKS